MYEQIARNKRSSWALMIVMVIILALIGYVIGRTWLHSSDWLQQISAIG